MNKEELINRLNAIVQLDIDAYHAYEQAIEAIDELEIRTKLELYRDDHHRHVTELSRAIRQLGGEPPEFTKDLKGEFIEGITKVQSMMGTQSALKAMETNEKLTNKTYAQATELDIPAAIRDIIDRGYNDEKKHLAYISNALATRAWERQPAHAGSK